MSFNLTEINRRCREDAAAFIAECDQDYARRLAQAADRIMENLDRSPVVLLSGPSGSGKTTTAMKICEVLEERGIHTHSVSMDDYFKTVSPETTPRTPSGAYDLESPLCLDMDLLNEHFSALAEGKRIYVPKYDFVHQARLMRMGRSLKLRKNEVAVLEGIHALNDAITTQHPEAFKLYISARTDVMFGAKLAFKRSWFRLVRRTVRDHNFRGTDPMETIAMWANVRRGETRYTSPFREKADFEFDTAFAYELAVFNTTATELFRAIPEGIERFDELRMVLPALQLFGHIDESLVAPDALIREFIGGGIYEY